MPAAGLDPDVRDFLAGRADGRVLAAPEAGAGGGAGWRWAPPVLPPGFHAGPWPMPLALLPANDPAL
jgi:hypothetical protein